MRTAQLLALSGLMLMSNVAMGAELDHDDVPNRCWRVCGPVVGIAHKCDNIHESDRAEMKCICDWHHAPTLIPLCEACIAEYRSERNNRDHDDDDDDDDDDRDPHHNDAYDILRSCSLSTTSYNPTAAASAVSSASTDATDTTPTATPTGIADSTNGGSSGGSSGISNSNLASNTNTATSAQNTDNAASAYSTPKAASLAAVVGLGFLAWL